MDTRRSEGITIMALLALSLGIWNIVSQIYAILWMPGLLSHCMSTGSCKFLVLLMELSKGPYFPLALLNLMYCFSAYGTLRMRNWAREILVAVSFIFIFIPIMGHSVQYFYFPTTAILKPLASDTTIYFDSIANYSPAMIVFLFIIIFFTRPEVKEQFM